MAPVSSDKATCPIEPVIWKSGATPRITSSGPMPIQSRYVWALKTTLPCVVIAPLGGPVVPEV